jgi:prepilin-type N-terminal cleavage/methylation domain-containing protein
MSHARRGLSLVELTVVLALLGLIGAMIGSTMVRQQRFYRGASELLAARAEVRDAMELLSTDIRGMSPADTVRLMADSAIEFFASIGSSVICQTTATEVGLPAVRPSANTLSAFLSQPDTGDLALFYDQSGIGSSSWEPHRIVSLISRSLAASCPASSGFSEQSDVDAGHKGFLLSLATPLSPVVGPGAPVRFIRRGRYSLYRAADGKWYLGYRRCNALGASACGAIQPLSGPYRPYSSNRRTTGFLLEYFNAAGVRLDAASEALSLARVDITARSESPQRIMVEGRAASYSDSATISVALRNRSP